MSQQPYKIALVHDFLLAYGGAERVLQALSDMYPEAPIYTLLEAKKMTAKYFPGRIICPSFLQNLPQWLRQHYRWFLPWYPVVIESFNLREFDLVISSSGAWSKGVVTRLHTKHLAYLHSPMRFAWDAHDEMLADNQTTGKLHFFRRLILSYCRIWDREAAERPDQLVANSRYTLARIEKYYRRKAELIFPPALALFERFGSDKKAARRAKHFLVVARLTRSKKIDIVIEAFNKLELPLIVVGTGPQESKLRKQAGPHISFRGEVNDEELATLYREARALLQPSEEDFGLVSIEALSFGVPVIAYERGEAREIIIPKKTGELFHAQTSEILADGVRRFIERENDYSEAAMKEIAAQFRTNYFCSEIKRVVDQLMAPTS